MKNTSKKTEAMEFYASNGLVSSYKKAQTFAGKGGRIATLPDIISARMNSGLFTVEWSNYFATASAEYFGFGRSGKPIIIIAHGIGPLATLSGIQKAYSHEYKDKTRNNSGGRITQEEFYKLEDGHYGPVAIVDYESYCELYRYPLLQVLTTEECLADPLVAARLGNASAEFCKKHADVTNEYIQKWSGPIDNKNPHILRLEDASNCPYSVGGHRPGEPREYTRLDRGDGPIAHLLVIEQAQGTNVEDARDSYVTRISCQEWWHGTRFVGVKKDVSSLTSITKGPALIHKFVKQHWTNLIDDVKTPRTPLVFNSLVELDGQLFTQHPKQGARMDTAEAEYPVNLAEKVGDKVFFKTSAGSGFFFKYEIREVLAIKPTEANAYLVVGAPGHCGNDQIGVHIQFYKVEVDATRRLRRYNKIEDDTRLILDVMEQQMQKEAA